MSGLSPTAQSAFTQPNSVQQFATDYGLSPFQIPNSTSTGYEGANPNAPGQDLYVGPDGQVYNTNQLGQETPGTPSSGSYQTYAQQNPTPGAAAAGAEQSLLNPSQLAAMAPQPYQAFGNVPTVSPTTATAAQTDLQQMPGALQSFAAENSQAMQPTFQAQDMALQDNLGQRGIVNSGANTYLNNELAQGQSSTLAGMNAPLTEQFANLYGSAQLSNTANQQQTTLANQSASNTDAASNAGFYNNAVQGNQNSYNAFMGDLLSSGTNYGNGVLSGITNTYAPANSSALTTLGQSPGQVGAAYTNGMNSFNPAGFAAGTSAIQNAFTNPSNNSGGTNTTTINQGSDSILNPEVSASYN